MNIKVNGRRVDVPELLSYDTVAIIVRGQVDGPLLSVTYRHDAHGKDGILAPGESILTAEGLTIINALVTDNA